MKLPERASRRSVTVEAVAALSVILGLVFVAIEIRDSNAVARAEARREASAQNIDFVMQLTTDPDLNRLWTQEWTEEFVSSLSPEDQMRIFRSAVALTLRLETVYLQYREGVLDSASLGSYGMVQPKLREPWFKQFWAETYRPLLDPDFVAYFERTNRY